PKIKTGAKRRNKRTKILKSPTGEAQVLVLAVERYLRDRTGPGPASGSGSSLYDVTVTGLGVPVKKYLLSPQLNRLVQRNLLSSGCLLRVSRFSALPNGVPVIERAEALGAASPAPAAGLPASLPGSRPLTTCRRHYLPLWGDSDYYGEEWRAMDKSPVFANQNIITLKELEMTWKGRWKLPPLLVKVMYKSRLRHYGKPCKNVDWPYQAYFEVADCSGMMTAVLWNSLCPRLFRSLEIGTVLLIQQYVVKDGYQKRTRPVSYYPEIKICNEIDISLNSQKPTADIKIIPQNQVKPEWRLPEINNIFFVSRNKLETLPDNYTCDVIGLVTFVGRCERIRKTDDEDFWIRRFVEMVDETSEKPFILELYSTSQPEIHEKLHPVTFLVCTQMRIIGSNLQTGKPITYLTSSSETQIYVTGYHKGRPYTADSRVKRFIQWAKSQQEKDFLERAFVGGHYSFPLLPSSFREYSQSIKEITLTSMGEVKEKIESLNYKEHKRLVVQGIITSVRYNSPSPSAECLTDKEHIQVCSLSLYYIIKSPILGVNGIEEVANFEPKEVAFDYSWQSSKWPNIKRQVKEILPFGQLLPESYPHRFKYSQKEELMRKHNLHPSSYVSTLLDSTKNAKEFTSALNHGYYSVTIVDLNQEIAMDIVFLPSGLGVDRIFDTSANDTSLISILSGACTSETAVSNGNKHFYN
uniref:RPA1 related single stranded DNA binding protein, X-linked n=1 Tax=Callorhinchus milii TaxID=7868 RepID=A0A4W3JS73_CALMI